MKASKRDLADNFFRALLNKHETINYIIVSSAATQTVKEFPMYDVESFMRMIF